MIISYFSAPCGAGKTYQIIQRACEIANFCGNVLILMPTKQLINRTVESELLTKDRCPPYKIIYSGSSGRSAAHRELTKHFENPGDAGQIVFATHQVLPFVRFLANKQNWTVMVDETIQVLVHEHHTIPYNHDIITKHLHLEQHNSIYSKVSGWGDELVDIGRNPKKDQIFELLSNTARNITNERYESFCDSEKYKQLLNGENDTLAIHSILKPQIFDGFHSVLMAVANFRDTLTYQVWSQRGIRFIEDAEIARSLKFQEHRNGSLATIYYADTKEWSKRRSSTVCNPDSNATVQDLIVQGTKKLFGDGAFLWRANKGDLIDNPFGSNAKQLSNKPHGLNDFLQFHDIAFLPALNPYPEDIRFMEDSLGLSTADIRRAIFYQDAYQSIMRTSLRVPDNTNPKRIVVPEIGLGRYLQSLLPGSGLVLLETGIPNVGEVRKVGRKRLHESDRDRVNQWRKKQDQAVLDGLNRLWAHYASSKRELRSGIEPKGLCNETPIVDSHFVTKLFTDTIPQQGSGTLYSARNSDYPRAYLNLWELDHFIQFLEASFSRTIENKTANLLLSPAIFDPDHPNRGGEQKRGVGNILYLKNIWFDFDEGQLGRDQIAKLFPNIQLIVFNSYSHTKQHPRFRVIVPTNNRLTPDAYERLWDIFARKIERAGYQVWKKKRGDKTTFKNGHSGLDDSKRSAASMFFLPCQAKDPTQSFFDVYDGPERTVLDSLAWLNNTLRLDYPEPVVIPFPNNIQRTVKQEKVRIATEEWRMANHSEGDNDRFYRYAQKLQWAGMSSPEIERELQSEVQFANDPMKRRTKIKSIMSSLKQSTTRKAASKD